jgi:hypothetical protein
MPFVSLKPTLPLMAHPSSLAPLEASLRRRAEQKVRFYVSTASRIYVSLLHHLTSHSHISIPPSSFYM